MKSVRDRKLKKLASKGENSENGLTEEQMLELVECLDI